MLRSMYALHTSTFLLYECYMHLSPDPSSFKEGSVMLDYFSDLLVSSNMKFHNIDTTSINLTIHHQTHDHNIPQLYEDMTQNDLFV